jgi:adenosylcobinamide-GDP ribazoletransferase
LHARTDSPVATGAGAGRSRRPWTGLAGALAFLTIVPVPAGVLGGVDLADAADAGLGGAAAWFPVVGAGIGALAGGVRLLCEPLVGRTVASVLAMIALVVATGALHQDGLADTADGLGVRGGAGARPRRLEVMRDSATGVFGAFALIAWVLLLVATVASLDGDRALRALIVACALARWAALAHAAATPAARADGLGAAMHVSRLALGAATAVCALGAFAISGIGAGAAAIGACAIVAALSVLFARRTLGGRTGDTLGATVAVAEVAVCIALLAAWQG